MNGIEKYFIHVRINVIGSPLELPGMYLFLSFIAEMLITLLSIVGVRLIELLLFAFCLVLETFPSIGSVRVKHRGVLLTLKGTVIRSGAIKMYEGERWYICRKCKHKWVEFTYVSNFIRLWMYLHATPCWFEFSPCYDSVQPSLGSQLYDPPFPPLLSRLY